MLSQIVFTNCVTNSSWGTEWVPAEPELGSPLHPDAHAATTAKTTPGRRPMRPLVQRSCHAKSPRVGARRDEACGGFRRASRSSTPHLLRAPRLDALTWPSSRG